MIRRFWLEDEATASRYMLDLSGGAFLADPVGLGIDAAPEFAALGGGFYAQISPDVETQQQGGGTIYFAPVRGGKPYDMYAAFVNWLASCRRLVLCYSPTPQRTYRRAAIVQRVTKTELQSRTLSCPVTFDFLTPWYEQRKLNIRMDAIPADVSRFGQARFGSARFARDYDLNFTAEIPVAGHLPAAIDLVFTGAVTNPVITLKGMETGEIYSSCAISVTLSDGDRLEFSSDPADTRIRKISGGVTTDLIDKVDPSSDPFRPMPVTEPCLLLFDGDDDPNGTTKASVRYFYRSV